MRFSLTLATLMLLSLPLAAEEVKPQKITVYPQAIESPFPQHRLYPEEAEVRSGNAAPILLRLPWEQERWMQEVAPKLREWSERPLSAPEWKTADQGLPEAFYQEMKRAAFRKSAEWEYPIGEQPAFFILLPDAQGLRRLLGHGLTTKIRYHLVHGELEQAREGILVGIANARHIARAPFFVNQLIAAAIYRTMLDQTTELVGRPGCPNLYWALASLPDLQTEFDRAAGFEGSLFSTTFPAATEMDRSRGAGEWRRMAEQLAGLLGELGELPDESKKGDTSLDRFLRGSGAADEADGRSLVKIARTELPQLISLPRDRVAMMSDEEAAVRWYVIQRVARDQRAAAVLRLPPSEAWSQLQQLEKDDAAMSKKLGRKEFAFSQPTSLYLGIQAPRRQSQLLRTVEAVRHYASVNKGALPDSLADIRDLTIPADPLTGKPFEWEVENGIAVLATPALPPTVPQELANRHHMELRLSAGPIARGGSVD